MKGGGGPSIPSDYTFQFGGTAGPTIQVNAGLDDIEVKSLPRFDIALAECVPITFNTNVAVKELPQIDASVGTTLAITEIPPITSNVNVAVTEIPEQRVHVPAHYQLAFSLFGVEIWSLSLCGETQAINEKYVPRRTEECK